MHPDIERLIILAKESGELNEKQKEIILRKAEELGEDIEEIEMALEAVKSKAHSIISTSEKKKKCPVCGAVVSYEARCPECGFAFDHIETSASIKDFFDELRLIHPRNISQKKQLIESFPIPNTKKDLLEFFILLKPLASDTKDDLVDTYFKKYSECIERAKTFFSDDIDFKPFIDSSERIRQSLKKGHLKRGVSNIRKGLRFFFIVIAAFVFIVLFILIDDSNKSYKALQASREYELELARNSVPSSSKPLAKELSLKDIAFSPSGSIGKYEYVDLGLSVKWATKNIGAKKINEVGDFYAWGEVKTKDQYYEELYFDYNSNRYRAGNYFYIKYNEDSGLNQLEGIDDVARKLWGSSWRIPTVKEVKELMDNCTFQLCTVEDVTGIQITSDLNSNSIFIPCAGYVEKDMLLKDEMDGFFWTSSLDLGSIFREYAFALKVGFLGEKVISEYRYYGFPIRPVSQ